MHLEHYSFHKLNQQKSLLLSAETIATLVGENEDIYKLQCCILGICQ